MTGEVNDRYDLALVGSVGRSELHRFDGSVEPILGGPIVHCALATSWSEKRVAVVTRMAERDTDLLNPLREKGITVFVSPTADTTRGHLFYFSQDVDHRKHVLEKTAGPFSLADLPPISVSLLHLVGHNKLEFPLQFIVDLHERGMSFSIDMQALVREPDLETGTVTYRDYPHKREVANMAEKVKLDAVEAELLTGFGDPEEAAIRIEEWGAREVMITSALGALVRYKGSTYFERFSSRSLAGRTGRGDTAFGSYLIRRMDHGVADALRFAVALTSIKMETPGPFAGTLHEVLERMATDYC